MTFWSNNLNRVIFLDIEIDSLAYVHIADF